MRDVSISRSLASCLTYVLCTTDEDLLIEHLVLLNVSYCDLLQ